MTCDSGYWDDISQYLQRSDTFTTGIDYGLDTLIPHGHIIHDFIICTSETLCLPCIHTHGCQLAKAMEWLSPLIHVIIISHDAVSITVWIFFWNFHGGDFVHSKFQVFETYIYRLHVNKLIAFSDILLLFLVG